MTDERDDALRAALGRVEGRSAALRLVVALDARSGVPTPEAAERYGVPVRTAYDWVERFDGVPADPDALAAAARDADRPGRPAKLSPGERARLGHTLASPPSDAGFDATEWTPALLAALVSERFGVDYSARHARRLLDRLG